MTLPGIDRLAFYTTPFYLDLKDLAKANGMDEKKYYEGIGQERMSVMPPDEDVVTMAANAAKIALEGQDLSKITGLFFATETSVDQSKSAGIFVHKLLGLSDYCRIVELKQACYSGTVALQMATKMLKHKDDKILVIGADNARYERASSGEATQGCGAVAMLISHDPDILSLHDESAILTNDIMDFWRPNYRKEAIVDGKFSTKVYLSAFQECFKRYSEDASRTLSEIPHFLFHLPFTRIAEKALSVLFRKQPTELTQRLEKAKSSLVYNRLVGNSYTASLYIALCSLLDHTEHDLSQQNIGLFSYGSGFTAEFFTAHLVSGYQKHLKSSQHKDMIAQRKQLSYDEYLTFYHYQLPEDGSTHTIPAYTTGAFRLAGIDQHKRIYEGNHYA